MRFLLDTHAFLWWLLDDRRLSEAAKRAIERDYNDVLISAASAWEIATKHRIGKLPIAEAIVGDIVSAIDREGFEELSITVLDAARAGVLPCPIRDPFDRMLIAQALSHNLVLIKSCRSSA